MNNCLLLSGGIDSIAVCYWQRPSYAITVDYGQAASDAEIAASEQVCIALEIPHQVIRADCSRLGSGIMVKNQAHLFASPSIEPPTPEWWPYRNQLIVTLAASHCVKLGIKELIIGSVMTDSQYADGTNEFIQGLNRLLSMQEGGISLLAPAIDMTSQELVEESGVPESILAWAHSCHCDNIPCGQCRGCHKYWEVINRLT